MAREKTQGSSSSSSSPMAEKVRVTLEIPKVLDRNVEVCCAFEGVKKTDMIALAITTFLKGKGYEPNRTPVGPAY